MQLQPCEAIVTGAAGFIGSFLVDSLLGKGCKVIAVVRKASPHSKRLPPHPNLRVVKGNLADISTWQEKLSGLRPAVFYHLAWHGVGNAQRNSLRQLENISMALATLQLARKLGCRRWVGAGSQAEYGPLNRPIAETDPAEPTTLYGAAKLSACLLARILGEQTGIETTWVRIFSTYGPGDKEGWLLTDLIKKLLKGERPSLTAGEQLWDYLYAADAAEAFVHLGINPKTTGVYNLGSGRSQTIRSVAETVRDMIDPALELGLGDLPYRPDQVMHLEANIAKLKKATGWYPRTTLEQGIRQTIDYSISQSKSRWKT